ncbi:hypothetical protein OA57_06270 [Chelonobacter oris]|uniref:Transferrin-binding protein B C-lobe/N-lobe beta barrel domain-containing protein n=1 Tax=Chelonobacter oris TaxID=505317 RepID=A0A0A3ATN0_9PAST|nr:hypothetical protein [Chelonobacter oris]KGQ70445.1 hypothetical protein OA57_06270 [Chelonobacter oris]
MRNNGYTKTALAVLLSAFLAACGGGSGGGSSNSDSKPIANNLVAVPNGEVSNSNKVDESAVAALKEKEARQKAEEERKTRLAEKEKADKEDANKEQAPTGVQQDDAVAVPPKEESAASAEPENPPTAEAVRETVYEGKSISLDGSKADWNGKAVNYTVVKEGDQFKAMPNKDSIRIGDTKLELIDAKQADLGYYGYVSTFTPDSGIVGEGSGQKRTVDLLYAYDGNKKENEAPKLDGYSGTVTYQGDFWYVTNGADNADKANIELNYNPTAKTLGGNIRETQKGIDFDLKLAGELGGDFIMEVNPAKSSHTSDRVSEKGALNGQFLDGGKYIVGDAQSGDAGRQWSAVFATQETKRVPKQD